MNSIKKQTNSINNISNIKKFILSDEQINLLKEAFDLFDMEKTGKIDFHELKLTLKAFGFKISKEEMFIIKEKLDPQNTNKISFDDFIDLMTQKFSERNPREEAIMAFDLFDEEKKGKINIKNLKKAVKEINENLSDMELKAIIDEFDNDKDGFITKNDFLKIMDEYYFD
jgi:centrin-3